MSSKTLHKKGINHNHASWLVHHMPLMPKFEPSGVDQWTVEFNEGYVYDYANGGEKLLIEPEEEITIGQTETKELKIQLTIDKFNGKISKALIMEDDGDLDDFTNLENKSDIEGEDSASDEESEQQIMLDFCELRGPSIYEQYIRENIHIWLRGFYQKGDEEGGHAPLKKDPSAGANDMIEIRELREKDEEDNILEITTEGDSILFYVPDDGSSVSDSGSDKSTAIVPMDWHEKGYGALFTMESNEVLFEFVMRNVSLVGSKTVVAIDDRFLKVCEPDSMVITGITGNRAGSVGAVVEKNNIILSAWPLSFLRPTKVTLKLTGVRKGFKRYDMPERSREQFIANEEFINSAYPKE